MNKPYGERKQYAIWIERGQVLGRYLNRLREGGFYKRICESSTASIRRLVRPMDVAFRRWSSPR